MNNPSSEPQIPEPPKVTRRAIISGLAGLVGVAVVGSTLAAGKKNINLMKNILQKKPQSTKKLYRSGLIGLQPVP